MIVTTISREQIHSISLPEKVAGQYWLYDFSNGASTHLVSIEGINEKWILKSNRQNKVLNDEESAVRSREIAPLGIYPIKKALNERSFVFVEPSTKDRQVFAKYQVRGNIQLTIGRGNDNDIRFDNRSVSTRHAVLSHVGGKWVLQDTGSKNGTFVNEKRIQSVYLSIGDTIFIMGLKIIVGLDFLAINNPDGKASVTDKLMRFSAQQALPFDDEEEYELPEQDYFYRSPRFKRDISTVEFKIDPPPTSPVAEEMPWLLVMGSSMAMGMMSLVTLFSAIASKNVTSMVMGGSMLIGTLLLPMITKRYERNMKYKKEALRQEKYKAYLEKISADIQAACRQQAEILSENNVTLRECETRIKGTQRALWERSMGQNDFLRVRVGHGNGLLDAKFTYQARKFSLDEDNLQEALYNLCEEPKVLQNIPITYSLFDHHVSGVIGERNERVQFAKGLIIQLASMYSYDEVKFVFLYDAEDSKEFEFVKWLPHVWRDDQKFRFVATNTAEVKELSAYLEGITSARAELGENDIEEETPYYIIFSMSKKLASHAEMMKQVLSHKENIHFSIVTLYDRLNDLPKECSMVVELAGGSSRLFDKNDISGEATAFIPDLTLSEDPLALSVHLANISLNNGESTYTLPGTITFLEMFGVGKVEHLNALTRWKESDPTKSLGAAIGVDTMGEPFMLDLHQKFHGPHGLVAGMTGSGKSETIITYILSLAVNYHPNEVAFILIDYKGGGMAKSFEKLPHTAGIITNLDGAAIKRSLVSIESELKRRQQIFADVSKNTGVSNIDIYKYQKLFREGTVTEPLQHLFIISDEFAELKTQQPEFMTQLVSAARIGRSLGIHLILATQKPSGVVDDQIWSNSRFRVCLKVQERADSMDMLKRPDAAELTDTGRFFLQVGYNELFEMGQSAWAGAPYYPSDKAQKEKDNSVVVIDNNGHSIKEVRIDRRRAMFPNPKKQLDVVTKYLEDIAAEEGIKVRPLWLDPIPATILLDQVKEKYHAYDSGFHLNPIIGEYDDPAHQQQCVLRLPISDEGNTVVYGVAGSGKTSFLNAMIYSLISDHTPDEVNLYILDFASETLRAFARAPHVGEVILSYEAEKVSNLFKMLQQEAERRKKLFADFGGDYTSYIRASGKTMPSIVVAINNFAAFTEIYEEKEEAVSYLSREGTKYGIYFVLTALGTGAVRFRLLQNFKQLFVLQLNDESDYSTIVGKTDGLFPSKNKGRGLVKTDALYEYQIASLVSEGLPFTFIQDACRKLSEAWTGNTAKKVPILPDVVNAEFLKDYIIPGKKLNIPIGVEKNSLNAHYYPFGSSYINLVLSSDNEYQEFVSNLAVFVGAHVGMRTIVFDVPKSVTAASGAMKVVSAAKDCEQEISDLFNLVVYRNNTTKDAIAQGTEPESFEHLVIIINSISQLKNALSSTGVEMLSLILEKGSASFNLTVMIGEQVKALSSVTYEKWYKAHVSGADGIWVGSGIAEQYQMKPSKTTSEMHDEISPAFGYSLIRGKAVKVKLLKEKTEDSDDDE